MAVEGTSAPSKGGFPIWLVVIGVLLICGIVVGIIACVTVGGLTLAGPTIGNSMSQIILQLECPVQTGLIQEECDAWAEEVAREHSDVLTACQQDSSDESADFYQCVVDEVGEP